MTRRLLTSTALAAFTFVLAAPQGARAADPAKLKTSISTLASERFGGRLTGTDGERLAREFIVSELKRIGAKPLPGQRDFALPFEFTAGARDAGTSLSIPGRTRALAFSDSGEASGPVVFAGYGIVVPESQDFGYDSYAMLDVKDKIVVVLRYFPEDADQKTRAVLARYSDLRYKAMAARQRGAKAVLVVAGPRSPNAGELVPMTFDTALSGSGIVAASIDGEAGNALMAAAGKTLADVQHSLDSGNPHVAGFEIPLTVTVKTRVERERHEAFNIAGYLPATARVAFPKPWLAIGAHYDHLGRGENGSSLASKEEAGRIHGGADDNASGDAAVLALGEELSKQQRPRHIMLAFWSGEELGLLGSAAFIAKPPVPLADLAAYLNFDMVGRMQDNKLSVQASGTSASWARMVEQANVRAGFNVNLQPDPYQPTDVANFNTAGVPCLNFFTGAHGDYHKPSDTADKIDYDDLVRIVDFAAAIARRVVDGAEAPVFAKVEPQTQGGASRAGVRVYTGTVPDYASDAKGLLLGGVVAGGPAEASGLQKGDIIVEIAGQTIANIYDYTYALDVLKIGEPATVVYIRAGKRKETTLTPGARK
jgi:peptidase M28-like protein/PDZ domain-containing protein/PA domain-containing protein